MVYGILILKRHFGKQIVSKVVSKYYIDIETFVNTDLLFKQQLKPLFSGYGAPAAYFVEVCKSFNLINKQQMEECLDNHHNGIHARHMKRQRKRRGRRGYKWTRTRSNHIGKL